MIMRKIHRAAFGFAFLLLFTGYAFSQSNWDLARKNKNILTVTTLFTAQDVGKNLAKSEGLDFAVDWCKKTGITKVYLETYRDNYYVNREVIENAKKRFLGEGFEVSGCVTPTRIKKASAGGWNVVSCYTNKETQEELQRIFEFTASLFDEIMVDDFLFTDCTCEECIEAKGSREWADYRSDLMVDVSRERILKASKAVNPKARIIIKYPLWYDSFHERGYVVDRETEIFDHIYVGTETRDYDFDVNDGGTVQYNAYFIMRWLGEIGGEKTGGGWFDALGTTPDTYLEQARQTVLADAKELMLFCYGNLISLTNKYDGWEGTGIANVEAFRKELPQLFELARIVRNKPVKGINFPKLPNSRPFEEQYVYSYIGMLGLPLAPSHSINELADASIFTVHMLKQPGVSDILKRMVNNGKTVMITDGLAERLTDRNLLKHKNLSVIEVDGKPKDLIRLTREQLNPMRDKILAPLGMKFDAPNKVGLYLYGDDCCVIENFNKEPVSVTITLPSASDARKLLVLPAEGKAELERNGKNITVRDLSARTLVAFKFR